MLADSSAALDRIVEKCEAIRLLCAFWLDPEGVILKGLIVAAGFPRSMNLRMWESRHSIFEQALAWCSELGPNEYQFIMARKNTREHIELFDYQSYSMVSQTPPD